MVPDLDDGVVLTIAPLHRLVPWREAEQRWKELLAGKVRLVLGQPAAPRQGPYFMTQPTHPRDVRPVGADYPAVTDALLAEVVDRILGAGSPERIVLFGSRARGDARPDSDLDLLIIEESDLAPARRDARYYRALAGVLPAKDILVFTPQELAQWEHVPYAFTTTILREGRTLYAR